MNTAGQTPEAPGDLCTWAASQKGRSSRPADALSTRNPPEANRRRPEVENLEKRLAAARQRQEEDEKALAEVKPDGTRASMDAWCLRSSALAGSRRAVGLLEVDSKVMREVLERELFLARCSESWGRKVCEACGGTGDGESIEAGTCLVRSPCDTCAGEGFVRGRPGS